MVVTICFPRVLACCLLFIVCASSARGAEWTPDPSVPNPELHRRLYDIGRRYCETHFDPKVNLVFTKPRDHVIRESAYYAYGLLMTGDPADRNRAQAILRSVLKYQDARPNSAWCGAFLWTAEQSWQSAQNPDLNSAAFVGATLVRIATRDREHPVLDADLREQVNHAGRLAVGEIMRRNVEPGYTNIALLSSDVVAGGAKLWAVPGADKWADAELDAVLKLADGGSVYEYLSPTYMFVNLGAAYGARANAFSDEFAKKADAMIDHLWNEVAMSYHAPTCQLAGPHVRSYGENMLEYSAGLKYWLYLALDGKYPIPDAEADHAWDQAGTIGMAEIPVGHRPEFDAPVPAWREIRVVGPNDGRHPTRHLFQYRDGNFVLGTVAFQDEWKQKRNLVAYWRNDGPPPLNMRVGYCVDESNETLPNGFPYAQVHFYSRQVKGAALVALTTSSAIPAAGGHEMVFDHDAKAAGGAGNSPIRIEDGSITTYLYPITPGAARYEARSDARTFRLTRPWSSADVVGDLHVLSCLIVFRPAGQPAPAVSDLSLRTDRGAVVARATVDGASLSASFKH